MFNNSESFPILIANKSFPCQFSFTCLLLPSICGTENSSQQTSLQCLSTINMIFSDEDKILIKSLYLKGYTADTAERLTKECPEKSVTKHGANKLLKKFRDIVVRRPGSGRPRSEKKNSYAFVYLIFQIFC